MILSDTWTLAIDPENQGKEQKWFENDRQEGAQEAPVPGILQQVYPDYHGVAWYWHSFTPDFTAAAENDCLLKFEFVDYYAEFWLNGKYLGSHEGGEMPFELDATSSLRFGKKNTLVIRLINPVNEPIDGFNLQETPHGNKVPTGVWSGSRFNYGGIFVPVHLVSVPKIRISDLFLRPDVKTGEVKITATVLNTSGASAAARLTVQAGPKVSGGVSASTAIELTAAPGENTFELSLTIPQHQLWSTDDPFLYSCTARLNSQEITRRFGFRDFRVVKGFFRLNGQRVFLRCTHTGNHTPVTQIVPSKYIYQDLIFAKASGFNAVRFISGACFQEQLDFCDEIGLMVYEECSSSWLLKESDQFAERFDIPTLEMIKRDRSHPSVVIWGLLNETWETPVSQHARIILPKVRAMDDTRLVLYSSGRWDCQLDVGSVCNPGSSEWQFEWGEEAPGKAAMPLEPKHKAFFSPEFDFPGGLFEKMGDIHVYPIVPHSQENNALVRSVGANSRPVFLSEFGMGSLFDAIRLLRQYEQMGVRSDLVEVTYVSAIVERLEADWARFGMEGTYPFAAEFLRDSQRLQSRMRTLTFDLLRSNAQFCGYNLTGMLDHAYTGEGLWTFYREWKPEIAETLQDGWSPLRWCLFVNPMHIYSGRPFEVEGVLANEDVLQSGEYPVCFRITGPEGILWEKRISLQVPQVEAGEDGPLAIPAIKETVTLNAGSGSYQFNAYMERGGAPSGGRLNFWVSNVAEFPQISGSVRAWGLEEKTEAWLKSNRIVCKDLSQTSETASSLILVGDLSKLETSAEDWQRLFTEIAAGSTAIFLSASAFQRGDDRVAWLPLEKKGRLYPFNDWLYHKEIVAKAHPYFAGLYGKGIMNIEYFDHLTGHDLFDGQDTPDEVFAAAFATGYPTPGGYASGVCSGAYKLGEGRFVLNVFHIEENLDANPAAERILLNMINYESSRLFKRPE